MHLSAYPEFNSRCSFRYWGTPVHKNFNLQTFWLANKSIWWTLFFFCKLFIRRQTWPYLSHMNTHVANFSKTVEQFKFMNHWDRRRPGMPGSVLWDGSMWSQKCSGDPGNLETEWTCNTCWGKPQKVSRDTQESMRTTPVSAGGASLLIQILLTSLQPSPIAKCWAVRFNIYNSWSHFVDPCISPFLEWQHLLMLLLLNVIYFFVIFSGTVNQEFAWNFRGDFDFAALLEQLRFWWLLVKN